MINIFYLLLLFSFICLLFMIYYYFKFLNTTVTGNTFKDLIIVYHKNFGSYKYDPDKIEFHAYIYWDPKEKLIVYNSNMIHFYGRSSDLYVKLFGFNALIRRIYFKDDFEFLIHHPFSWSVIFSDLLNRYATTWKDKNYWFSLLKTFILFLLVLLILFLLPNLFLTEFLNYLINLRKFLILLFFFFLLFIIYKILYNQNENEEYIANYPYIKLLVLFWKLGINAVEFFNNFLCVIFNLFLLVLIFNYFNLSLLLTKALIIYFAIIWTINILNLLANRLLNSYIEKNKIIAFLSKISCKSFLLFPLICFILYIFFKVYWWLKFVLLSLTGKKREYLIAHLKDLFLTNKNYYPYVFSIYRDEELDKHLARLYFTANYCSSYHSLIGQKEFNKILETKKD